MNQFCAAAFPKKRFRAHSALLSLLAILPPLLICSARGEDPDSQYIQIFDVIQQGDLMKKNGQVDAALAKYREAQTALAKFQRSYPERDAKVAAYRLNYVSTQIAVLSPQESNTGTNTGTTNVSPSGTKWPSTGLTQVKLLEPGAEPRKVLRFHPKPGDKQSMVLSMKMAMAIKVGDAAEQPIKLPLMKLVMDSSVQDVATNGDITYDIVTSDGSIGEDPDVIAQVADAMKNAVAGMKGVGGKGILSSRGINKGTDIKAPPGADPQVSQFVEQMKETMAHVSTPLPEEPVGPGAKWEIKIPVKSQGMTLNQTITFELASVDGDRATGKTSITQSASNQKIQSPMMPGTKVDLTKMTGNGTGEVTFDLGQLLPPEASVSLHQEMFTSISAGGQKQSTDMKMDLNLHLESK